MNRSTVRLRKQLRPRANARDAFFWLFYFPLNFALIYLPVAFHVGINPRVKMERRVEWELSHGPEMWMVFHLLMALLLALVVFWLSSWCYRPKCFVWWPIFLGICGAVMYFVLEGA